MKKIKYILLVVLLSFGFCITVKSQEKGIYAATKAVKVKSYYKREKNGINHLVVCGYSKKNKKIWSHKANSGEEYQEKRATYKKRGNKVYFFDGKKLKVYKLSNGKKIRQFKISIQAGHVYSFDSKDNLYITGYEYSEVYKINSKGKRIWKSSVRKLGLGNGYKIKYKRGIVTVYYEVSPSSEDLDIDYHYYACFNAKNGKIVKYRR